VIDAARSGPGRMDRILTEVLDGLRRNLVAPVLAALEYQEPLTDQATGPRVWWCPTGPLAVLPLHAAAIDHVISSYTITLTALLNSRTRPPPTGLPRLLAVGMPDTPNQPSLPWVREELDRIDASIPIITRVEHPLASRRLVLDALGRHTWAHFAGHAGAYQDKPTDPAIVLSDGPLHVTQIATRQLRAAEFIYLSACRTFLGDGDLQDESIHLAAACQFAGYRHVVASLWPLGDQDAARYAEEVYRQLADTADDGRPDLGQAAMALHRATRRLRSKRPDLWAPYLHLGP
jgi:CHAT domain-containing protein